MLTGVAGCGDNANDQSGNLKSLGASSNSTPTESSGPGESISARGSGDVAHLLPQISARRSELVRDETTQLIAGALADAQLVITDEELDAARRAFIDALGREQFERLMNNQ